MMEQNIDSESNNEGIKFKHTLGASLIDVIAVGIISLAALFLVDVVLRFTGGYYVKEKISMLFIIYIICSILYTSIMENRKEGNTIGKKMMNLKVTKIK